MDKRVIPPAKPYFPPDDILLIQSEARKILECGMLTLGDYTRRFEMEFAKLCQVKHAVAVSSGTSALEISLRSLGLRESEEVLVPTNTFSATAAAVIFAGGKPVFTDIDANSLCIDAENVQKYMTHKTRGVIPVHIGGLVCPDMKAIKTICKDRNLFLIEDAAHAHGSAIGEKPAGSLGDIGCFSMYPTKVMTTGEGGVLTTNREDLAQKATILRDQGKESFGSNIIVELGYNWRMDEISAAVGLTQLKRLHEFIKHRNEIAKYYTEEISKISEVKPLEVPRKTMINYYKYIAFLTPELSRDMFKQKLRERGVKCSGEVYWPPLHMQPLYKRLLGVKEGDFPVAEEMCKRMVCLPLYSQMSQDEAKYVIEKVKEVLSNS